MKKIYGFLQMIGLILKKHRTGGEIMKKRITSLSFIINLLIVCILAGMVQPMETSAASQKHVVIWSIKGNKLKYHKACSAAEYLGPIEWDNVIGSGKRKNIKISPKATYHLLDLISFKSRKVSKEKFIKKSVLYSANKWKENGKTYYTGMACKLTIKNGKVVKFVQEFQS